MKNDYIAALTVIAISVYALLMQSMAMFLRDLLSIMDRGVVLHIV